MATLVIGAGTGGLVTLKELLSKNLDVKCYEKSSTFGGIFSIKQYQDVVLTTPHCSMVYSDFYPNMEDLKYKFLTFKEYHDYLLKYINNFNLLDHIHFNTEVVNVSKIDTGYKVLIKRNIPSTLFINHIQNMDI